MSGGLAPLETAEPGMVFGVKISSATADLLIASCAPLSRTPGGRGLGPNRRIAIMTVRACRSSSLALRTSRVFLYAALVGWMLPSTSQARNLTVGPGRMYATIHAASQACQAGDTVSVEPGTYTGDVASWTKPNLLIRAADPANKPHVTANGQLANSMGVFHVSPAATSCTIDGFNIEGA